MYTQYVFAVEVGAVVLLVGMVAAIALTLRQRRDAKYQRPADQIKVRARDRLRMVSMASQTEVPPAAPDAPEQAQGRSEEHTSELQSLMRISYAVFCLKKKKHK